jgi:hypothetical protein
MSEPGAPGDFGRERRKSPRAKCRFRCELARPGERADGMVVDVSEGGLSVHTPLELQQGETLIARVAVPNRGKLELEALVWHVRRARRRDTGEPCCVVGLMLSKVPDDYLGLLPRSTPEQRHKPETAPGAKSHPLFDLEPESVDLHSFRIRVKARSGPRTRILSLSAESENEARALAMVELEGSWDVLEVQPA